MGNEVLGKIRYTNELYNVSDIEHITISNIENSAFSVRNDFSDSGLALSSDWEGVNLLIGLILQYEGKFG